LGSPAYARRADRAALADPLLPPSRPCRPRDRTSRPCPRGPRGPARTRRRSSRCRRRRRRRPSWRPRCRGAPSRARESAGSRSQARSRRSTRALASLYDGGEIPPTPRWRRVVLLLTSDPCRFDLAARFTRARLDDVTLAGTAFVVYGVAGLGLGGMWG